MTDIAGVAVTRNVRCPFEFGRIGMASTDIFVLKSFELLSGAQFVGHDC